MRVTFWGVRGSIPTPGVETARYGGNTLCVQVELPGCGRTVVIDAGSGIRALGDELVRRHGTHAGLGLDVLLSHTHLDHILGLPFFRPLYQRRTRVKLYGPAVSPEDGLEQVIGGQMSYRYFPVRQVELAARIDYIDLREGEYDLGDGIRLKATYLNHPLLCLGYRLEHSGAALCTAFDTEPFRNLFVTDPADPRYDEAMAIEGEAAARDAAERMHAFFQDSDLLIHDGQFTEAEYRAGRQGWGHSSMEAAIDTAERCGVKHLALIHHDPVRTDDELDRLAAGLGGVRPESGLQVSFAAEGLTVEL
jgi:phosphoribosyl 1,2-cyclic phosphodiesterase